ncbi:MAG: sugar phosphate isomerase/epimerase [Sulfolobus sp.]|nr:sugar phosphate isomerase/epimerase [Sulfolobus sp.]
MPRVALQLYSVRDFCSRDFRRALEEVASIGYEGVEFAGFYNWRAEDLRDLLKSLGLKVAGAHIGISELQGEKLKSTIMYNKTIGNNNIVVPGLPEEMRKTKEAWLNTARLFNSLSETLRKEGLRLGYHNHRIEFETKFDGETAWKLFFKNTLEDIMIQLDIGHAIAAGNTSRDIINLINEFPGRVKSAHIKDYSKVKGYDVFIGEGDVSWKEVLKALNDVGKIEWYIVEQETYKNLTSMEAVKIDLDNLKRIIKELS